MNYGKIIKGKCDECSDGIDKNIFLWTAHDSGSDSMCLCHKHLEKWSQKVVKEMRRDYDVCLWPPEDDDVIWTVIVKEEGKEKRTPFSFHHTARLHAESEGRRLGVIPWVPTRDGDSRDL